MKHVYFAHSHATQRSRALAFVLGLLLPTAVPAAAFAQAAPGGGAPAPGGAAPAAGAPGAGAPAGGTTSTTVQGSTSYQYFPGGVAPTPEGQTLGGGNVQYSSSKPITGSNQQDTFDFGRGGGAATVHGNPNGSFVLGKGRGVQGRTETPNVHVVRRGDTLWDICGTYFQNPYQWPRIWSYNPQIQNPHWIYPGDQVKLREGAFASITEPSKGGGSIIDRRKQVPAQTVFLRNKGYIDDDTNNWGEITGSREDKMILSNYDEVYLRIASNHDLKVGQELTVFRPLRSVGDGKVIEIQGTVKVDQWNPKERIARARITESLDAIERGARVGPISRRFEVVPPERNDDNVEAEVLTSVLPHNFFGQNQVVFINKGKKAGLEPGNRLLVIRKGDAWHQTLPSEPAGKRIALENDSPAAIEDVPHPRDPSVLPEEVLAELRVINVREDTAMCLVTTSRREIESGDKAYARKGY